MDNECTDADIVQDSECPLQQQQQQQQHHTAENTQDEEVSSTNSSSDDFKLALFFLLLVVFGSANTVFYKLQAIPLYNYPNFLNIFGNGAYVVLTFLYIIPVARFGWLNNTISPAQVAMSKKPFAVIGLLDCMATSLQIFAAVYLPGPLLVLLPQAAIPISMALSRYLRGAKYKSFQYVGAVVVILGILVVLEPVLSQRHAPPFLCEAINIDNDCTVCQTETNENDCLSHYSLDPALAAFAHATTTTTTTTTWESSLETPVQILPHALNMISSNTTQLCKWVPRGSANKGEHGLVLLWSVILMLSCIPMTLSGIYKEIALDGEIELDPVFINGWVAFFQTIFSCFLAVPAGMFMSPVVPPDRLWSNMRDGFKCYLGVGTVHTGCNPDTMCATWAAAYLNLGLVVNVVYTVATILVLRYGSANLYFLALTVMVPLGNLTFALPFMPDKTKFHLSDIMGLAVIVAGLVMYRFAGSTEEEEEDKPSNQTPETGDLREPLLGEDTQDEVI